MAIFFLFPRKKFLPISFKIQLLETSPQKQKKQRQTKLDVSFSDVFSLPVQCTLLILCDLLLFCQVCILVKETAEIETGMAEKSTWDQANIGQKKTRFVFLEIEDYLFAKLSTLLLLTILPLIYFMFPTYWRYFHGRYAAKSLMTNWLSFYLLCTL